jgi:glycosyltransferase involved in cell wall biosynthesis
MSKASVIIFTYNQSGYICQALEGACRQTIKPVEIIVVDDASTDSTFDIATKWISERADPLVSIVRNKVNMGLVASVSTWASQSKGDIVIPMAGDDISDPRRVEQVMRHFAANPSSYALVASGETIDKDGQLIGAYGNGLDRSISMATCEPLSGDFLNNLGATGASAAYRREVFTQFPQMNKDAFAEDRILCFRAILLGACDFSSESHVRWRRHEANLSRDTRGERNAALAIHFNRCAAMVQQHLDDLAHVDGNLAGKKKLLEMGLRYQHARWRLLSAANDSGIPANRFLTAWRDMRSCAPSLICMMRDSLRPALHLLTPFVVRQALAQFLCRSAQRP